jgi:hypothetical protein
MTRAKRALRSAPLPSEEVTTQLNLRQVHLIQSELFEEMRGFGFAIAPGDLGENITAVGD